MKSGQSLKEMNQTQLRSHFEKFKPLPLKEALEQAELRRVQFEKTNEKYIDDNVRSIFEPMVINLLNLQPEDTLASMKEWLMMQFNTQYNKDENYQNNFSLSDFDNWHRDPEYQQRI